jgi:predicted Zn-dependent peptidase
VKRPPEPGKLDPAVWLIERPGAEQSAVALGMASIPRAHPDYLGLRIANQVFGGGASSRLFMKLREEQSLTYGAYSTLDCGLFAGDISAELACAPEKTGAALTALRVELDRMANGEIDADDLSHAKRFLVGAFPQRASGVAGVASLVTARWIHSLGDDVWTRYQHGIEAVGPAEAGACSMRWFRPEASVWVIVGPESGLDRADEAVRDWGFEVHRRTMSDVDFEGVSGT